MIPLNRIRRSVWKERRIIGSNAGKFEAMCTERSRAQPTYGGGEPEQLFSKTKVELVLCSLLRFSANHRCLSPFHVFFPPSPSSPFFTESLAVSLLDMSNLFYVEKIGDDRSCFHSLSLALLHSSPLGFVYYFFFPNTNTIYNLII